MTEERALQIALEVLDGRPYLCEVWERETEPWAGFRLSVEQRAEIGYLVGEGWSSARIADRLGVTVRSVQRHRSRMRAEEGAWLHEQIRRANLATFQVRDEAAATSEVEALKARRKAGAA